MSTVQPTLFYDLALAVFLLASALLGAHSGLVRTLLSLGGRLVSVLGAAALARAAAPAVAAALVTPIVGGAFAARAEIELAPVESAVDALEEAVTAAAVSMAEGVAFLILLFLGAIVISFALRALGAALSFVIRTGPLGTLNRLAGAAAGLAGGVLLIVLALFLASRLAPDLFAPLGALSPDRIAETTLLRSILTVFPIV